MPINLVGGAGGLGDPALEAVNRIGSGAGGSGAGVKPAAPNGNDVQRFQEAMNRGVEGPAPTDGVKGTTPPVMTPSTNGSVPPESAADRILRGISSAGQRVADAREVVGEVLQKDNVSQADLLRANFAMIESSTVVSAISKSSEKMTSAIKTLQQG